MTVERAEEQRVPFVRLADRYAIFFLPATMLVYRPVAAFRSQSFQPADRT